jgi:ankyrin repeat protein
MEMINKLLAADVDPNAQLNMHRPSRGGNSGRFGDPLLSTGCTPLLRATMASDMEMVQALLSKGASPNVNDMGLTPFLVAAGVGTGNRGGTGLAAAASAGGAANTALMDLLIQGGADVNAQVTGTKTYSMRISRAPSSNEGMTALHAAVQGGRIDLVRYLIEKGANTEIVDSNGHKPMDLVAGGAAALPIAATAPAAGRGGRGGAGGGGGAANAPGIRAILENAASKNRLLPVTGR